MSVDIPSWRRLNPRSGGARAIAGVVMLGAAFLLFTLIALPLLDRVGEAHSRASRLDQRAAALLAAAEARRAEAEIVAPSASRIEAAEAWLATIAPRRTDEEAMLDLLSSIRLIAEATGVELASAAPLNASSGSTEAVFAAADMAGLSTTSAEARLVTDHVGLTRFLEGLEAASPMLRASAMTVTARSAGAAAEDRRLNLRVVIGALSRKPAE